jgi:hypothetical protein
MDELYAALGSRHTSGLYKLLDAWRSLYRCPDGSLGSSLADWAAHREQLRSITVEFLDESERGQKIWRDDGTVFNITGTKTSIPPRPF